MSKLPELFFLFSRVSLFTLGGGLAMLPLVEAELTEKRDWIEKTEFLDLFAVAQSMPGVMIMNVATAVGYKIAGIRGAAVAALGTALPPFISILAAAWFLLSAKDSPVMARIFAGIRPAIIALIAVPVVTLGRAAGIRPWQLPLIGLIVCAVLFRIAPSYIIMAALGVTAATLFLAR